MFVVGELAPSKNSLIAASYVALWENALAANSLRKSYVVAPLLADMTSITACIGLG